MDVDAFVAFMVDKLDKLLSKEEAQLLGVRGEIVQIRKELDQMRPFLRDADIKQKNDENVREWTEEIRDICFDVDYVIDILGKGQAAEGRHGFVESLKRWISDQIIWYKVCKEIERIKLNIKGISRSRESYGIREINEEGQEATSGGRQEASFSTPGLKLKLDRGFSTLSFTPFMASTKKITLKSSDGETFKVDEAVARQSQVIKLMIEDDCADFGIPIPNVTGKILAKVIEYCKKHVEMPKDADDRATEDELKAWDIEFVKVDQAVLVDLILAAKFLNINSLLDLTCQCLADMIKGKNSKILNNESNFTLEEDEELRREYQWAFE